MNIPYRGQGPLHLLIDSTGIKAEGEGEWHARKHSGGELAVGLCEGPITANGRIWAGGKLLATAGITWRG